MEDNTIKISHILFIILMMGIIIVVGTYAWLSYRSNDTAMVLTIGEINNVQVTLSPYQFKGSLLPQVTYTSDNYVNVTAINNSSSSRKIRLYYKINNIDSELISSDFKYTIERSTDGINYSEYKSGNFNGTSNDSELTILEENIPNTTTYNYKVYLWIDGTNSGQSYMQGKSFNGELRAEILSYNVTFDPNGGIVNISNKAVSYGEQYGTLPIPTRTGYTFLGWNGKNLAYLTIDSNLIGTNHATNTNIDINTGTLSGINNLSGNNFIGGAVSNLEINETYYVSWSDRTNIIDIYAYDNRLWGNNLFYNKKNPFSFTATTEKIILGFYVAPQNVGTITNFQIEKANSKTAFEPYYITENTIVVQNNDHTLTAIWQEN